MKIAVTVSDSSELVHCGGELHRVTSIIELRDDQIPPILLRHLEKVRKCREWQEKHGDGVSGYCYESVSFSLVEESPS